MKLAAKLKETAMSVLPVMAIVLLLGSTVAPMGFAMLRDFVLGGALLVVGLTIFLQGVDMGIQPMGEVCGAELTRRRSLPLLLGVAFAIGFIVTAAEPDIQVFGDQVRGVFPGVGKTALTFSIAVGVGLFIAVGLFRMVAGLSLKWTLALSYAVLFGVACLSQKAFIGIGFDSGGATTGPMTVPFILALGLGVSTVRSDSENSFGLTGVASVGPVLAVMAYSCLANVSGDAPSAAEAAAHSSPFLAAVREAGVSILPLYGLFILFRLFLVKLTTRQFARYTLGFLYAFVGLSVFLAGVNGGFVQAGAELGVLLGAKAQLGGWWFALLMATGLALGAIIVCAEPAVWVLSEQVEKVSNGMIGRRALLVFLSVGTALAIGLAMWRAVAGFSLLYVLVPGYALALLLMLRSPSLFSGIAFDSGGVASGPLTSTFVLSFTLGAASGNAAGADVFGVIALVAMMPLLAIQVMGIVFDAKRRRALKGGKP